MKTFQCKDNLKVIKQITFCNPAQIPRCSRVLKLAKLAEILPRLQIRTVRVAGALALPVEVRGQHFRAAGWRHMCSLRELPPHSWIRFGHGLNSGNILHIFKQMMLSVMDTGNSQLLGEVTTAPNSCFPKLTWLWCVPLLYCQRVSPALPPGPLPAQDFSLLREVLVFPGN